MQTNSDSGTAAGATSAGGIPNFDGASLFAFNDVDLPDGQAVYDRIMSGIDPELTSGNVGSLKEKYATETPEEKQARAKRYAAAYAEYDTQYAQYQAKRDGAVVRYKAQALKSLEDSNKKIEDADMLDLEQQIHSA
jgi:hypothetical protein